jgi:hypothetical protein
MAGDRIKRFSDKWKCPHCPGEQTASPLHIFSTCLKAREVWRLVNSLGRAHWAHNYSDFDYNQIPTILNEYEPHLLFQLGTIWSIWCQWTKYMYDSEFSPRDLADWTPQVLLSVKNEFIKRIYEMKPMTQWIDIVADRKIKRHDDNGRVMRISEKQFLLVQAHMVKTNPKYIDTPEQGNANAMKWIGTQHLLEQDTTHHRPRLRIKHQLWQRLIQSLGAQHPPLPIGRTSDWPAYVIE